MAQGAVIYSFNPAPGSGPGTSTAGAGPSGSSSQNIVQHQAFPIGNSAGTGTQYYTISPVGAADQAPGGPQSYVATPGPADGSAPNPGENSGPGSTATSPPYYGGFQGYPGYNTQPSPSTSSSVPLFICLHTSRQHKRSITHYKITMRTLSSARSRILQTCHQERSSLSRADFPIRIIHTFRRSILGCHLHGVQGTPIWMAGNEPCMTTQFDTP